MSFIQVEEAYIQDKFNLTGISELVSDYKAALQLILDDEHSDDLPEDEVQNIEHSAEMVRWCHCCCWCF